MSGTLDLYSPLINMLIKIGKDESTRGTHIDKQQGIYSPSELTCMHRGDRI